MSQSRRELSAFSTISENNQRICSISTMVRHSSYTLVACLVVATSSQTMAFQKAGYLSRVARKSLFGIRSQPLPISRISTRPSSLFSSSKLEQEVDPGVVEGTDLRIMKYPHPSLRDANSIISEEELKDGSIAKVAKELFLLMYAAEGVGLAAPQVGVNKRLMIFNESGDRTKWLSEITMVNPQIIEFSAGKDVDVEGCLSFPDMTGDVERSKWIKVEAVNLKGKKMKKKFTGWEARIFQHEYDHLDGVVYIDRLSEEGRATVQPTLDGLIETFGEGGAL